MDKKNIFKGFALFNFIVWMTVFLMYRYGAFDRFLNNSDPEMTSPNGGTPTQTAQGLTTTKPERQMLSSSKSIILTDDVKSSGEKDSMRHKELLYGSKSGIIIPKKRVENSTANPEMKQKP